MFNVVIVRYGEIGTKSRQTRRWFENILMNNIREALVSEEVEFKKVEAKHGRVLVKTNRAEEAVEVLKRVFGIVSLSPAMEIDAEMEKINRMALKLFRRKKRELRLEKPRFRVTARRITKEFPLKSPEIQAKVGEYILENEESEVNLHEYDIEVGVELMEGKAYIFVDKVKAWGGLPIGTQGKVVALLSGGIDSPVAAFLMMKRGVEVIPVHIYMGEKTLEKVRKIWNQLRKYGYGGKGELIVIKPKERERILQKLKELKKENYTCVFCKFMMVRHADRIARDFGAKGIVMGDSLGQVASQTLENMYIVSRASDLPIYRPLIGMDKEEIVKIAKEIGTFELSTLPEDEIPFIPRHPVIRGSWEEFRKLYKAVFGEEPKNRAC
ncbi:tRNA 4-thiouridine(8) synthase ThiI [Thermococcus sp. GR7]|uniref:tRNA uracil 4-sulfurtransferase ThiI n=1 Tax=unclassified Thermococcus TaxID=2627626 RepID=UPI00143217DE|nr:MULTISPECIES: tRNA uracil 4-sulfurtransferase ThiI [unclassified Thermococcus]NJE47755.1 tRNA 4-thiouridine(8) synthase ThiI [Thermococcus sp. GR7]NJE78727.1 tRNA 4-thiouridine(8) synthase ThiI [Thermococcus sp. GR4]NJF22389.1 tRNA 4-thiouridine(8) synthase ThiI [Thermococcus sp. GR5]